MTGLLTNNRFLYLLLLIAVVSWFVAYAETVQSLAAAWLENGNYSHGFLSLALAGYISYKQSESIRFREKVDFRFVLLFLAAGLIWWLGGLANVLKVQQLSAFMGFTAMVGLLLDRRSLSSVIVPLSLVLLVIPVWDFMQTPLQIASTNVTFKVLRLLGVPTMLQGYYITVPGGRFVVEPACSGLGFFLCAMTLGVVYSYLNNLGRVDSVKVILMFTGVSILANWIRIISILLVGNYAGMEHWVVNDHLAFGWVVFSLVLIPLFAFARYFFPGFTETRDTTRNFSPGRPDAATLVTLLIVIWLVPGFSLLHARVTVEQSPVEDLPALGGFGYVTTEPTLSNWQVHFPGADIERRGYHGPSGSFDLLRISYEEQSQDFELINLTNRFYGQEWREFSDEQINLSNGNAVGLKILTTERGVQRRMLYWYRVAGRTTSIPIVAKILEAVGQITGVKRSQLYLIISTTMEAEDQLAEFSALIQQQAGSEKEI